MEEFSIEKQFEKCKICLNRKSNYHNMDDVCNIIGMQMDFTDYCESFSLDKSAQRNALSASGELKLKDIKDVSLKPSQSRGKFAIGLIWLVAIIDLVVFSIYLVRYFLFLKQKNGEVLTNNAIENNDMLVGMGSLLFLISFIISGIFIIKWLLAIYYNLEARGVPLRHTKAFVIWSWFIPVINLYKPYQIMNELFAKTLQLIKLRKPDNNTETPSVIGFWWTLWIFLFILTRLGTSLPEKSTEESMTISLVMMVYFAIHILLAFTTVKMIKSFMDKEQLLLQLEEKNEIIFANSH